MRSQGDEAPSNEQLQWAREPRYFEGEINTFDLNIFFGLLWIFKDKYKKTMKDDRFTAFRDRSHCSKIKEKVKLWLSRHLGEGPEEWESIFHMKRRLFPEVIKRNPSWWTLVEKVKLCLRRHLVEGPRNGRVFFTWKGAFFQVIEKNPTWLTLFEKVKLCLRRHCTIGLGVSLGI